MTRPNPTPPAVIQQIREQLARAIVGQEAVIHLTLTALLCEGHVLFEGVPGLGKTLLVRSLARVLDLKAGRIQFTPDLMPADVVGTQVLRQTGAQDYGLEFEPGPVFAHLLLADEINRASPKTQSALLEAMQERAVTVRGQRHPLPRPFLVLATQNPLEMEGTYPLPEAQMDRFFFKITVESPDLADLVAIVDRTAAGAEPELEVCAGAEAVEALQQQAREVIASSEVVELAARLTLATQPAHPSAPEEVRRWVRYGAGPRGAQTLVAAARARALLEGRSHAGPDDLEALLLPALGHRMALNFDGQSEGVGPAAVLKAVAQAVLRNRK